MKPKDIRRTLQNEILNLNVADWVKNPEKDFTRNRKLDFQTTINLILSFEGRTMRNELISYFPQASHTPSQSAVVQQRYKLKENLFEMLFRSFTNNMPRNKSESLLKGFRLLAADGSTVQVPIDESQEESFCRGNVGQKPYNLVHLNALYDLENHVYEDAIITGYHKKGECVSLVEMVDRSPIEKALVIADRGYESYNVMAHIIEKGWFFAIRVKDAKSSGIVSSFDLPQSNAFDVPVTLNLTRKQTKKAKRLYSDSNYYRYLSHTSPFDYLPKHTRKEDPYIFYKLSFRIVRFPIADGVYETIVTNVPSDILPMDKLKKIYALRWGIETSFRSLKYTVGLMSFHSKKAEFIYQEIFARLIIYNFTALITAQIVIRNTDRKHSYQVNFSVAVYVCRQFFRGGISPPNLEAQIARNIVPIRPNRHNKRNMPDAPKLNFKYRVA